MSFMLVYDMPRSESTERTRIYRELKRIGAVKVQDSCWKSDDLKRLIEIARKIRKIGGKASILEEKLLF